jgi:RNase H-like domain found in reverse transcriptase
VDAIVNISRPTDAAKVHTFLGMVNFYHKFLPNVSSVLHPLHRLTRDDVEFEWDDECEAAFQKVKDELSSSKVLAHYDPTLPLVLATDASPYGLGVVLSHVMPNGSERPIAFGSRTLTKSEAYYR